MMFSATVMLGISETLMNSGNTGFVGSGRIGSHVLPLDANLTSIRRVIPTLS
jgi:hypothetical protein